LIISVLATQKMLPKLQQNFRSLAILFTIVGWGFMLLHGGPTNEGSTSLMLRNTCYVTGSNTEVILHVHSTKEHLFARLNTLLEGSLHPSGIGDSSNGTPSFDLVNLWVWTQSGPNVSIGQPLTSTLCNLVPSWMKKDVSEEEGDGCRLLNTSFHVIGDHSINSRVQIWSLSQSLNVFVQVARALSQVLSFLARSFILNGLRLTMGVG
jgi:hypothetical protein